MCCERERGRRAGERARAGTASGALHSSLRPPARLTTTTTHPLLLLPPPHHLPDGRARHNNTKGAAASARANPETRVSTSSPSRRPHEPSPHPSAPSNRPSGQVPSGPLHAAQRDCLAPALALSKGKRADLGVGNVCRSRAEGRPLPIVRQTPGSSQGARGHLHTHAHKRTSHPTPQARARACAQELPPTANPPTPRTTARVSARNRRAHPPPPPPLLPTPPIATTKG